jgi:glyoxylate/hydroxypyruvate reductase A
VNGLPTGAINVLFAARPESWEAYREALPAAFAAKGLKVDLRQEFPPEEVDYIVYAPNSRVQDFRPYTRAKAVLNLWAGVENVVHNETLTIPLCRMVEDGLTEGMVEWVTGHVLRHHLGTDTYVTRQDRAWTPVYPPLARDRRVVVLGLGELGSACARMLAALKFDVAGWSRTPRAIDGFRTFSGEHGLREALSGAEIAVLLLPLTPATESLMTAEKLSWLAPGAVLINPGRGALIDDEALLAALDSGHISHATLDVFRKEPLPPDHPFWAHPKVTVTPHVASETRPPTASLTIAENIRRGEAGEPLLYVVDRRRAY